ncbi:MAG: hypothetical protein II567_08460 [Candidatus Riflebacteria bacterium]|nr:hypothetical protein [Candidatus Riflebacteria bacterium]
MGKSEKLFNVVTCISYVIVVPIIIFLTLAIFFNEKLFLISYLESEHFIDSCVEISEDRIDTANDGKLVLLYGKLATKDILTDPLFKVSVDNSTSLTRIVEMYQWEEIKEKHRKRSGKRDIEYYTYSYHKSWRREPINSDLFHDKKGHENPKKTLHKSISIVADDITIGAHKIPSNMIGNYGPSETVVLDSSTISLPDADATIKGNEIYYKANNKEDYSIKKSDSLSKEKLEYLEKLPKIGDVKIYFVKHPVCDVTLLAKQNGDSFTHYNQGRKSFFDIKYGKVAKKDMFKDITALESFAMWMPRILVFLVMFFLITIIVNKYKYYGNILSVSIPLFIFSASIFFHWIPYKTVFALKSLAVCIISIIMTVVALFLINLSAYKEREKDFYDGHTFSKRNNNFKYEDDR